MLPSSLLNQTHSQSVAWMGPFRIWDLKKHSAREFQRRNAAVRTLSYSPDGELLAVGCRSRLARGAPASDGLAHKKVKVYDLSSGDVRCEIEHDDQVDAVAFSPNGRFLASGCSSGILKVYDFEQDSVFTVWRAGDLDAAAGFGGKIRSIAFSPNGKWLAAAGFGLKVWNTSNFMLYATLGGHASPIEGIAFSSTNRLASASLDHTVLIWDLNSAGTITQVHDFDGRVENVAICPNGEIAVYTFQPSQLALWDPLSDTVRYLDESGPFAISETGILATAVKRQDPTNGLGDREQSGKLA